MSSVDIKVHLKSGYQENAFQKAGFWIAVMHHIPCMNVFFEFTQLKKFLKTCKVANYCKQVKVVVDKMAECSKVITQRRKSATLALSDSKAVVSK